MYVGISDDVENTYVGIALCTHIHLMTPLSDTSFAVNLFQAWITMPSNFCSAVTGLVEARAVVVHFASPSPTTHNIRPGYLSTTPTHTTSLNTKPTDMSLQTHSALQQVV